VVEKIKPIKQREAISRLQANIPDEEHAAEHYTLLGSCFLDMGDVETAIDSLKRGPLLKRNLDEDLLGLHMTLGKALEQAGDTKGAIKEYQKVRSANIQFQDVEKRLQKLTGGGGPSAQTS
jgi:tetratricopeptide (TPR) repeat protein